MLRSKRRSTCLPAPPQRVLDVGTGTGAAARLAGARYPEADVVGVDVAERMVDEARRLTESTRVTYRVADAERLPFDDASFDLVTLNNMIPFFDELARVIAPDGHLVVAFTGGVRHADLRAAGTAAPRARQAGIRRICGGFCRTRDCASRPKALMSTHPERSRSGSTVLDVPSRGGVIRPVLLRR